MPTVNSLQVIDCEHGVAKRGKGYGKDDIIPGQPDTEMA